MKFLNEIDGAKRVKQDSNNRFVTDEEKQEWDSKETTTGSQNKANQAEQNAKDYADAGLADKVDKVAGKGLSTNDYTTVEKNKLNGIQAGANNYTHPSTHPPSIIAQDSNHRFVTDEEKEYWNTKGTPVAKTWNDLKGGKTWNDLRGM